jgi:hypothetical protein
MAGRALSRFPGRILGEDVVLSVFDSHLDIGLTVEVSSVSIRLTFAEMGFVDIREVGENTTLSIGDSDGIAVAVVTMAPADAMKAKDLIDRTRERARGRTR